MIKVNTSSSSAIPGQKSIQFGLNWQNDFNITYAITLFWMCHDDIFGAGWGWSVQSYPTTWGGGGNPPAHPLVHPLLSVTVKKNMTLQVSIIGHCPHAISEPGKQTLQSRGWTSVLVFIDKSLINTYRFTSSLLSIYLVAGMWISFSSHLPNS
jgi:hypothetical protein